MRRMALACFAVAVGIGACGDSDTTPPPDPGTPTGDYDLPRPSDYDSNPVLGMITSRRHLYVVPRRSGNDAAVARIAEAHGGRIAGRTDAIGLLQIVFPDDNTMDGLEAARAALLADPSIEIVARDLRSEPARTRPPRETPQGEILYAREELNVVPLLAVGAPQAWNFAYIEPEGGGPVPVAVLDIGFHPHPDLDGTLTAPDDCGPGGGDDCSIDHAVLVSGIIGASWNGSDTDGIARSVMMTGHRASSTGAQFSALTSMMASPPRLLNRSLGGNYYLNCVTLPNGTQRRCDPRAAGRVADGDACNPTKVEAELDAHASIVGKLLDAIDAVGEMLVVQAAGNDSGPMLGPGEDYCLSESRNDPPPAWGMGMFPAELSDAWTYAALRHGRSDIVVVEATTWNGVSDDDLTRLPPTQRSDYSNVGGHVFAPADGFVGLSFSGGTGGTRYAMLGGSSAATPMVTGAAAFLLSLNPDLTNEDLRTLLTQAPYATTVEGGGSTTQTRLNLRSAIRGLDDVGAPPARSFASRLADFDDGTADGFELYHLSETGEPIGMNTDDGQGDGVVDLRDFRRLRDTYLLYARELEVVDPDHPKLDLNLDGIVEDVANEHYPRVGLTESYTVDDRGGLLLGTMHTDVEVFAESYDGDALQTWTADDLPGLMRSADLHIHGAGVLSDSGIEEIEITVEGEAAGPERVPSNRAPLTNVRVSADETILTTPFRSNVRVEWRPICDGAPHEQEVVQELADLSPGEDRVVVLDRGDHPGCPGATMPDPRACESGPCRCFTSLIPEDEPEWELPVHAIITITSQEEGGPLFEEIREFHTYRVGTSLRFTETHRSPSGERVTETGVASFSTHNTIPGVHVVATVEDVVLYGSPLGCRDDGSAVVPSDGTTSEWTYRGFYTTRYTYRCENCGGAPECARARYGDLICEGTGVDTSPCCPRDEECLPEDTGGCGFSACEVHDECVPP